jgi:N6-adenosine-specific RNA methylase IME4
VPTKKYQIIHADPPWEYSGARSLASKSLLSGKFQDHYPHMTIQDICKLRVSAFADKDCLLFLWTTGPKLNLAFDVGKAWGFNSYATVAFVWDKININPGSYIVVFFVLFLF